MASRPSQRRRQERGQSLAEFIFVVPILLILFVAIADFGRIFATGIQIEAATRNAAEAAANEYIASPPGGVPLSAPAPTGASTYYNPLHAIAAKAVCAELRDLPNTDYDSGTGTCPDMPAVIVCVHDGQDTGCASRADPGTNPTPPECSSLVAGPTNAQATNPDGSKPRSVEVRACYHFTAMLHMPLFSLGDFWLQESASFTIPCYFAIGSPTECG